MYFAGTVGINLQAKYLSIVAYVIYALTGLALF